MPAAHTGQPPAGDGAGPARQDLTRTTSTTKGMTEPARSPVLATRRATVTACPALPTDEGAGISGRRGGCDAPG